VLVSSLAARGSFTGFGDWEASHAEPGTECCPPSAPRFYACVVGMERPSSTPVTVAQCSADIDQASARARGTAQSENPTFIARWASCDLTGCPSPEGGVL
jgi:hypothetical protein